MGVPMVRTARHRRPSPAFPECLGVTFPLDEPGDANDEQDGAEDQRNEKEHLPAAHDDPPVSCQAPIILNLSHFCGLEAPPYKGGLWPELCFGVQIWLCLNLADV